MSGFLQKLFAKPGPSSLDVTGENPVVSAKFTQNQASPVAAAAAFLEENAPAEYERFCVTFCHKPGESFMAAIARNRVTRLSRWLRPETREPEPKAFIRLILLMQAGGGEFWNQAGVSFYLKQRESDSGGPSPESAACVSLLAQILEKPIVYFYTDREKEEVLALDFPSSP